MKIEYASRENYLQQKRIQQAKEEDLLIIPEGGYGELGAKGITDISEEVVSRNYSHLLCAVGTGTMLAGFINSMPLSCICLGIPVLKGKQALGEAIKSLLVAKNKCWELIDGFEWGGYAKHPPELIQFMNQFFNETKIPTDIVYTGKLFYAFTQLIKQRYFKEGNKILLIHSGGLQGNRSLDSHELHFKY
jgi:1-aminocyclopropane-1-carboxylate deaminase